MKTFIYSILLFVGIINSYAQSNAFQKVNPNNADIVKLNKNIKLHYYNNEFSIDKCYVLDENMIVYSKTNNKIFLIGNNDLQIIDEFDFIKEIKGIEVKEIKMELDNGVIVNEVFPFASNPDFSMKENENKEISIGVIKVQKKLKLLTVKIVDNKIKPILKNYNKEKIFIDGSKIGDKDKSNCKSVVNMDTYCEYNNKQIYSFSNKAPVYSLGQRITEQCNSLYATSENVKTAENVFHMNYDKYFPSESTNQIEFINDLFVYASAGSDTLVVFDKDLEVKHHTTLKNVYEKYDINKRKYVLISNYLVKDNVDNQLYLVVLTMDRHRTYKYIVLKTNYQDGQINYSHVVNMVSPKDYYHISSIRSGVIYFVIGNKLYNKGYVYTYDSKRNISYY